MLRAAFGATDRRRRGHAGLVQEAGVRGGELVTEGKPLFDPETTYGRKA